jgi:aryl-alcohol dehydrogenase-like predicted oxidoreductase
MIKMRKLGKTGLEVSPIGLGVMQFAGGQGMFRVMFPEVAARDMVGIVQTAFEGGINWFDTAELYGQGRSESALSESLLEAGVKPEEVRIATKWSPLFRTARNIPKTIQRRLDYLDPFPIDLYQIHHPRSFSSIEAQMNAMADLVDEGKIRSVGVSNFNEDQMRRAADVLEKRGLNLASNQVQFSLLHRKIESSGLLNAARELGVTIIAWSPLASGLLTGKFHRDPEILARVPSVRRRQLSGQIEKSRKVIDTLEKISERHQAEPGQIALSWVIQGKDECVVAIPGASKVDHARESVEAMQIELDPAEIDDLNKVSQKFL